MQTGSSQCDQEQNFRAVFSGTQCISCHIVLEEHFSAKFPRIGFSTQELLPRVANCGSWLFLRGCKVGMVVVLAWYMQHLARQIARLQVVPNCTVSSFASPAVLASGTVSSFQIAVPLARTAGDAKFLAGQCPPAAGYPAPQHDSSGCMLYSVCV